MLIRAWKTNKSDATRLIFGPSTHGCRAKIVETQTALEETQKEIAAVEEEKAVRPDYEGPAA